MEQPTPEERLRLAREALEELVLLVPEGITRPEALLWSALLRALPIERTCRSCSSAFYITSPHDVRCAACEMQRHSEQRVGQAPQVNIPLLMLGVQTGLMRARDALAQLRLHAPQVAQLLDEEWATDRRLAAMTGPNDGAAPSGGAGPGDAVEALLRTVRSWMALADSPEGE